MGKLEKSIVKIIVTVLVIIGGYKIVEMISKKDDSFIDSTMSEHNKATEKKYLEVLNKQYKLEPSTNKK